MTRSANDVAVAIAEAIGGDEGDFAEMMTRKARALGMSGTVYRNASGLPNDEQITTARDLTILARSLEERFPRYFKYFSTHEFEYAGEVIGNHNHLLGRVAGVDGIKTGYTRASGFNLLTSVHRDGRYLLAVVMGGRTAGARDRVMENLIEDHIARGVDRAYGDDDRRCVGRRHCAARSGRDAERPAPSRRRSWRAPCADLRGLSLRRATTPTRTRPIRRMSPPSRRSPGRGRSSSRRRNPFRRSAPTPPPKAIQVAQAQSPARPATTVEPTPAQLGWAKGPDPAAKSPKTKSAETGARAKTPAETTVAARTAAKANDAAAGSKGWIIQIGATDDAAKASALLSKARERDPSALAAAKPVTEKVRKGEDTFYRARFAGLDPASAESACRSLKRSGFSCFAAHD